MPVENMQKRATATIVEQAAELLRSTVAAVDARGVVIACSDPALMGVDQTMLERVVMASVSVPLASPGEQGQIIVGEATCGEHIPPRVAQALVELLINQSSLHVQRPRHTKRKDQFLHDLLRGTVDDEEAAQREAKRLGLNLAPPRAVILIDAGAYILACEDGQRVRDGEARRRAQIVVGSIMSFFHLPSDTICTYLGDGEVAVLKASDSKNLANWVEPDAVFASANPSWMNVAALRRAGEALLMRLRHDTASPITLGIGRYHAGMLGLARSYQDARVALTLGHRFHGDDQVHSLDDLGIAAFVGIADETTKVELATFLLSPLDHEPDLQDTLTTFFEEHCSSSATAARLAIHRNTLSYRFDKITSLVGLDPRIFDDAMQIRLALIVRSMHAGST